jgi:hypothetical protein
MKFFKTTEEFVSVVPVTAQNEVTKYEGSNNYAIEHFLEKWLSKEFIDEVEALYQAGTVVAKWTVLIPKIQAALGNITLANQIPIGQVTIDDSGITRKENDHFKSAHTGQINMLLTECLGRGYNYLESLLEFLEANEDDYPVWKASTAYTKNKEFFINSSIEFNDNYPIMRGRITFKSLFPIMKDVELLIIEVALGTLFFDYLKEKIQTKTAFTSEEKKLLVCLKKAIAYFAIEQAIAKQWVKLTSNSVIFTEHDQDTNNVLETTAQNEQASLKISDAKEKGSIWLSKAINYIKSNLDNFTVFRDDETVNPVIEETTCPENKTGHKSFFSV